VPVPNLADLFFVKIILPCNKRTICKVLGVRSV
jgi:hypothetical protein